MPGVIPSTAARLKEAPAGNKPEPGEVIVAIGEVPIRLRCEDTEFMEFIRRRYAGYVSDSDEAAFDFVIETGAPEVRSLDEDIQVSWNSGQWFISRGDFHAQFDPAAARGHISQAANPYALDSVLRIVHTLLLAQRGGFLMHASSAIRHGRAFVFAGVSGAGKTTMARLAPADTVLLTDEISYVVPQGGEYLAVGTPFYGELARSGDNQRAPIAAVYLLEKGTVNSIKSVAGAEAVRGLLANILFFARESESVKRVFDAACDFAARVPISRLTFAPDARVWEMIG